MLNIFWIEKEQNQHFHLVFWTSHPKCVCQFCVFSTFHSFITSWRNPAESWKPSNFPSYLASLGEYKSSRINAYTCKGGRWRRFHHKCARFYNFPFSLCQTQKHQKDENFPSWKKEEKSMIEFHRERGPSCEALLLCSKCLLCHKFTSQRKGE